MIEIIQGADPDAFLVISDVSEVRGGSFKKRDVH
jgi:uncharacterized membrane-anchored protein YitT (DUF2179 family)